MAKNDETQVWAIAEAAAGDKDLGDPAFVSHLVRGFASHILTLRSEWHAAPDDEKIDPTEEIQEMAVELGDVFLGRRPEYRAHSFNSRSRLGVLMRHVVPTTGDPGSPFFDWYALQVVRASMEMEAGGGEADVFGQLESITSDVIGRLIAPVST